MTMTTASPPPPVPVWVTVALAATTAAIPQADIMLDIRQANRALGLPCGSRLLQRAIRAGVGPNSRIIGGRKIYVALADLSVWWNSRRSGGGE